MSSPKPVYVTLVTLSDPNLRSGAGAQFGVIATLLIGDPLELVEPNEQNIARIGLAGQWVQVKTTTGLIGWVNALVVERAFVVPATNGHSEPRIAPSEGARVAVRPEAPAKPHMALHTTATNGVRLRSGPGVQFPSGSLTVTASDRLQPLGDYAIVHDRLGKYGEWIYVRTPNGAAGWAPAWYVEPYPEYFVWTEGHALAGIHGPTEVWPDRWDEEAYQIIENGRIEAVKLIVSQDFTGDTDVAAGIVQRLRDGGVRFILAHLFAQFGGLPRTPEDFVKEVAPAAAAIAQQGVTYFEIHNEPNLTLPHSQKGLFNSWQNGAQFGEFFTESVRLLKQIIPNGWFGFPGLSPGLAEPKTKYASGTFLMEASAAILAADFACLHTFWGGDNTTYLNSVSKVKEFCNKYPDKLILVTKFANTALSVSKDVKGREYALFYSEAKKLPSNLGALFSFALSSSGELGEQMWKGSSIAQYVGARAK